MSDHSGAFCIKAINFFLNFVARSEVFNSVIIDSDLAKEIMSRKEKLLIIIITIILQILQKVSLRGLVPSQILSTHVKEF